MNKRKYPRVSTNVNVKLWGELVDKFTRDYLEGVAENCNLGGMFFATDHLLPKGSVVTLEFKISDMLNQEKTITASAIVRWVKRWRKPQGMGLEFLEFKGIDGESFGQWMSTMFIDGEEAQ